ncbi:glycosyltransferase [Thermithiobacillus plumbiphilus]|uniref:Glycosyltransferase n=1 Tax=Thermithiobacillus plumbiphilus TaxID=1729899 RepID=A0ABU9D9S8_9PROT
MKILQIAYPFERVAEDAAGGTEQMVSVLDEEYTRHGHESVVLGRSDSRVAGRLVPGAPPGVDFETASRLHFKALERLLAREHFDVLHNQGSHVQHQLSQPPAPLLSTLHLARVLLDRLPFTGNAHHFYNFVSSSQQAEYADCPLAETIPVIPNGIRLDRFAPAPARGDHFLCIGRICPEKGYHHAITAAASIDAPLVIIGKVYPFESHVRYFETTIAAQLGPRLRFVEAPSIQQKRLLLAEARALLIPSEVAETSSLVAMEAAACGTPVIAFRRGALPEVVVDGQTGFLVEDVEGMIAAMRRLPDIDPQTCRRHAELHFSGKRMARDYLALYQEISRTQSGRRARC